MITFLIISIASIIALTMGFEAIIYLETQKS